ESVPLVFHMVALNLARFCSPPRALIPLSRMPCTSPSPAAQAGPHTSTATIAALRNRLIGSPRTEERERRTGTPMFPRAGPAVNEKRHPIALTGRPRGGIVPPPRPPTPAERSADHAETRPTLRDRPARGGADGRRPAGAARGDGDGGLGHRGA